jgi:C4-dicarboxylate-specific signal transduction histidine kinase
MNTNLIESAFFDSYFVAPKSINMKNLSYVFGFNETTATANPSTISLHNLVDRLMDSFIPLAVAKNSFIVNDIDAAFDIQADEQVLAFVVGNLLSNVISSSKSVCIRVEAIRKENGIQLKVRNNGAFFYSTVAHSFAPVLEAAKQLGGSINIYNQKNEGTVITFSMAA